MSKSELRITSTTRFPIRLVESELAERLREVIGDEPGAAFARRAGVGESLLRTYLRGSIPGADKLVQLADAAGVNVDWLASGRGPKRGGLVVQEPPAAWASQPQAVDIERLRKALEAVQTGLQAVKRTLPPSKYADLVVAAYELMGSPSTGSAQIIQFIKAAT